jgi:hypothetical protein
LKKILFSGPVRALLLRLAAEARFILGEKYDLGGKYDVTEQLADRR